MLKNINFNGTSIMPSCILRKSCCRCGWILSDLVALQSFAKQLQKSSLKFIGRVHFSSTLTSLTWILGTDCLGRFLLLFCQEVWEHCAVGGFQFEQLSLSWLTFTVLAYKRCSYMFGSNCAQAMPTVIFTPLLTQTVVNFFSGNIPETVIGSRWWFSRKI